MYTSKVLEYYQLQLLEEKGMYCLVSFSNRTLQSNLDRTKSHLQ